MNNDFNRIGTEFANTVAISHDPVDTSVTPIALLYSGGKDSTACLKILREQGLLDQTCVVWTNTGDAYPETLALMQRTRDAVPHFCEVRTNVLGWKQENGIPTDILPVSSTPIWRIAYGATAPAMVLPSACCGANLWMPMFNFLAQSRFKIVVRGEKNCDVPRGPIRNMQIVNGMTYLLPLEDWSDADVVAYLGDELPDHYTQGAMTSLDCLHCTGYMDEIAKKSDYLRREYPEVWKDISQSLRAILAAVNNEAKIMARLVEKTDAK